MQEGLMRGASSASRVSEGSKSCIFGLSIVVLVSAMAIIGLPFTRALTIDMGFPLKLYEILLPFAVLFLFVERKFQSSRQLESVVLNLILFFAIVLFSSLIASLYSDSHTVEFRGGRLKDTFMRCIYLLFNISVFIVAYFATTKSASVMIVAWFVGFYLAFSYHAYTIFAMLLTGDAYLLPGLERHQFGWVGSLLIPRSGTFEEGNFASLYYLATLALALYTKSKLKFVLAVIAVVVTLSTAAYAGLFLLILTYIIGAHRGRITFRGFLYVTILAAALVALFLQLQFLAKFTEEASSGAVRLNESVTGLRMFYANPWLGVGLGGYGYYFDKFEWLTGLEQLSNADKRIPNNVYVELLAETGIFGTLLFLAACYKIAKAYFACDRCLPFTSFSVAVGVVWIAYPTFNITYLWFFMGISLAIALQMQTSLR